MLCLHLLLKASEFSTPHVSGWLKYRDFRCPTIWSFNKLR